jgi:hypothetical protein
MVKQAEKVVKRNPMVPVYGIVIGVGLLIVAIFVTQLLLVELPQVKAALIGMGRQAGLGRAAIIFGVWLTLMGIAMFLVAILTGKDPESIKGMPMPNRTIKKKK